MAMSKSYYVLTRIPTVQILVQKERKGDKIVYDQTIYSIWRVRVRVFTYKQN